MKLERSVLLAALVAVAACSKEDDPPPPDTTGPAVALATPTADATVTGQVELTATASDAVRVSLVEFLVDGAVVGSDATAPYSFSWNTALVANGSYEITARATDSSGNATACAAVNVTVANTDVTAPTVALTAPVAGTAELTGTITLTATASDNVGVRSVVFLVDGEPVGFDHTAPYELRLNTAYLGRLSGTSWVGGSHTFAARAIDVWGNAGETAAVTRVVANRTLVAVGADITADTTWTADKVYRLTAPVYVIGTGSTVTLTIDPGTLVVGNQGSALIVTKTGRVVADASANDTVIFTSDEPFGDRSRGDWGGVVLLGAAPINVAATYNIEGLSASPETSYGGTDAAHDCGTLRYVRIEYAGYVFGTNNELNGLTLGGCGTGTTIDYVQVHKGLDDGIEMFGGTANLKHVVISWPDDDGLDWDFGWQGNVQFLVVQQEQSAGDKGFECDNNPTNNAATPLSQPRIYNATVVGSGKMSGGAPAQTGLHFKNGTAGELANLILTRFADAALDLDGSSTKANVDGGTLTIKSSIVFGNGGGGASWGPDPDADTIDDNTLFAAAGNQNRTEDPMLTSYRLEAPSYVPLPGSPALSGAAAVPADAFFQAVDFVGAVRDEAGDWTAGWTAYPSN